jgi:hypothetical protein
MKIVLLSPSPLEKDWDEAIFLLLNSFNAQKDNTRIYFGKFIISA